MYMTHLGWIPHEEEIKEPIQGKTRYGDGPGREEGLIAKIKSQFACIKNQKYFIPISYICIILDPPVPQIINYQLYP